MPHDGPGEHYHDLGERVGASEDTVVWTTVGLDIGSSTSQAVFSRITLRREDAYYVVNERTILHQSEVLLTPYATPELIDPKRLGEFIDRSFASAKLSRAEIDTGAVIMTGLALSTRNARAIAEVVADESGQFVAVSAGDALEARLAAHGAGLPELSARCDGVILHVDIGGGTTKLSTWMRGELQHLAAIDVGARLITVDSQRCVTRIEPAVARLIAELRLDIRLGEQLADASADTLATALAQEILRYGGVLPGSRPHATLLRTAPLFEPDETPRVRAIVFSGGVSEYIYLRETRLFGDLGAALGRAVRNAVAVTGIRLLECERGIRATVLGASQHSVQLSGNTIFVSDPACLPLKNLAVILAPFDLRAEQIDALGLQNRLTQVLDQETGAGAATRFAIAIHWQGSPTFQRLEAVAAAIAASIESRLGWGQPCVVIVDGDVAGLLGARLRHGVSAARSVVCLDGVYVHEFDHVDIGEIGRTSRAVPVVVKSLLFARPREHVHVQH